MKCLFLGYFWRVAQALQEAENAELAGVGLELNRTRSLEAKEFCESSGQPWFSAENIRNNAAFHAIIEQGIDLIVVGAFGQILPEAILRAPSIGIINVHPSFLPAYRGNCPIEYQILNGEPEGGVTLHWMTQGVDAGPIISQKKIPIDENDDYDAIFMRAHHTAARLMAELLKKSPHAWARVPQTEDSLPLPSLQKKEGLINWGLPAENLLRFVRANGWKKWVRTEFADGDALVITKARIPSEQSEPDVSPGTVVSVAPHPIIRTGKGNMELLEFSGKKLNVGEVLPSTGKR